MILKRIFTLTLFTVVLTFQSYSQQKIEITAPAKSMDKIDLRLNQQAYEKFRKYEQSSTKNRPSQIVAKQHSFDLNQALWQHNLEKVMDNQGNVIAVKGSINGIKELKSPKSRINSYVSHLKGIYNIKNAADELGIMSTTTDHNGYSLSLIHI